MANLLLGWGLGMVVRRPWHVYSLGVPNHPRFCRFATGPKYGQTLISVPVDIADDSVYLTYVKFQNPSQAFVRGSGHCLQFLKDYQFL